MVPVKRSMRTYLSILGVLLLSFGAVWLRTCFTVSEVSLHLFRHGSIFLQSGWGSLWLEPRMERHRHIFKFETQEVGYDTFYSSPISPGDPLPELGWPITLFGEWNFDYYSRSTVIGAIIQIPYWFPCLLIILVAIVFQSKRRTGRQLQR